MNQQNNPSDLAALGHLPKHWEGFYGNDLYIQCRFASIHKHRNVIGSPRFVLERVLKD